MPLVLSEITTRGVTMDAKDKFKQQLKRGRVYRRAQLTKYSKSADRYLRELVREGELEKLMVGVYYRPKKSTFGYVPADGQQLIETVLKCNTFLVTSLNSYNALKVGTTQLYNERLVYNTKRHGRLLLNGQGYYFLKRQKFPKKVSEEFLLVDLINNINMLAEDRSKLKVHVLKRAQALGMKKMCKVANTYGKATTKKFFSCGNFEEELTYAE